MAAVSLALALGTAVAIAEEPAKSADEITKELSNPAGSLASLNFNFQYQTFNGDLPGADDQDSWSARSLVTNGISAGGTTIATAR